MRVADSEKHGNVAIVLHNDDDTPEEFVVNLLINVFGYSIAHAAKLTAEVDTNGKSVCGIYAKDDGYALLGKAHHHLAAAGHQLLITIEPAAETLTCK